MKKIQNLKKVFLLTFILILMLCTFDYLNVHFFKNPNQRIWPVYHWTLGFERIPSIVYRGEIKIISCDSITYPKPIPIERFVKNQNLIWRHNSYYKYLNKMISKNKEKKEKTKKLLEAHLFSRLSCEILIYSLIRVRKNLKTKKESRKIMKIFEYRKL